MKSQNIRIILADDHPLIRDALKNVLLKHADLEIVGEANNGEQAFELTCELNPDVVIMDISMPKMSGLEATRKIKNQCPKVAVLILTVHDDSEHIFALLECGAAGYLTKSVFGEEIVQSVRAVAFGESVMTPEVLAKIVGQHRLRAPKSIDGDLSERFSSRELEIIRLVARGIGNKQIAETLGVSLSTVRGYLEQVFAKLNAASRTEAVVTALRVGLIEMDDLSRKGCT